MDGDGGAGVSLLEDRRARERARQLQRTWAAGAQGQSGLPSPAGPVRQRGIQQPTLARPGGMGGAGETVTLVGSRDIASGTALLQWLEMVEAPPGSSGFPGLLLPTSSLRPGLTDVYYDLHLEIVRDGGGAFDVTVLVDFEEAWQPLVSPSGYLKTVVPLGPLTPEHTVQVLVSSGDYTYRGTLQAIETGTAPTDPGDGELAPAWSRNSATFTGTGSGTKVRDTTVPNDTEPGDLLLIVFAAANWFSQNAALGIDDIDTDGMAFSVIDPIAVKMTSPTGMYGLWGKVAQAGDAGRPVSAVFQGSSNYYAILQVIRIAGPVAGWFDLTTATYNASADTTLTPAQGGAGQFAVICGVSTGFAGGANCAVITADEDTTFQSIVCHVSPRLTLLAMPDPVTGPQSFDVLTGGHTQLIRMWRLSIG